MSGVLEVRFGAATVGLVAEDDRFGLRFTYAAGWLAHGACFPVSLSLPLRAEPWLEEAAAWFGNLLPGAGARAAVCGRLGLSEANDFALLRAIGGECAGALQILDAEAPSSVAGASGEPRWLEGRDLSALVAVGAAPLLFGGPSVRLSLAGAQNKVPVVVRGESIGLPSGESASTHLLKLPHPRFKHLPMNEAFVMGFAASVGLEVAGTMVFRGTSPPSLLVQRYDRSSPAAGQPVARIHQEDLCQATGRPAHRKYEQEGGPTLAECIAVVARHAARPLVDVRRLVEWQAFNVVAGNADGHGKNLSIVYEAGSPRLAPFYDVLATRQYPALDRFLAMGVGGERDPDRLGRKHWESLAREAGLGPQLVASIVKGMAERCAAALPEWVAEFTRLEGRQPILQTLPNAIARRAAAVARAMS